MCAQASDLAKCVSGFKPYTARQMLNHRERHGANSTLQRLSFAKKAHMQDRNYQFWQEGSQAELVCSAEIMRQQLDYII